MRTFPEYITQRLTTMSGYSLVSRKDNDVFMRSSDGKLVWICYLDAAIGAEDIRRAFGFKGHILFVVNEKLVPDEIESREKTPMWLRVLHGLYMGRVYVWNQRFLFGLHFDYDTGDISESTAIQVDDLLLVETGTWLRGWTDQYKLARFFDKAWWMGANDGGEAQSEWTESRKQTWEEAYSQRPPPGDRDYAYGGWTPPKNHHRYSWAGDSKWNSYDVGGNPFGQQQKQAPPKEPPRQDPPPPPPSSNAAFKEAERKRLDAFMACKTFGEAKLLYRRLLREFHPDLNPGQDTNETMKAINTAWAKAERMWQ